MSAKNFFNKEQQLSIQLAIKAAELNTSGEIRVHIDDKCKGDVLDSAANNFHQLKMNKTVLRNGVLFYLSVDDHKFAVLGDKGIDKVVPADFWESTKTLLKTHFSQGLYRPKRQIYGHQRINKTIRHLIGQCYSFQCSRTLRQHGQERFQ